MHINEKNFETHKWWIPMSIVSNGWKAPEIRNKSHVGKTIIWHFQIDQNWLGKSKGKTYSNHFEKLSQK